MCDSNSIKPWVGKHRQLKTFDELADEQEKFMKDEKK